MMNELKLNGEREAGDGGKSAGRANKRASLMRLPPPSPPNVHKFQHLLILMGIFLSFYKSFRKMQRGKAAASGAAGLQCAV